VPTSRPDQLDELLRRSTRPSAKTVTWPGGPLLSSPARVGQTRVLTHRIAWLIGTERARPGEILSITFTNRAAQEMRERVELRSARHTLDVADDVPRRVRADAAREAPRLGYTRTFTIYDQADSRRLVKRCSRAGARRKRYTPSAVQHQISAAKNWLRSAEDYRQLVGDHFETIVATPTSSTSATCTA
jgi:DNA helicase-2/ATP-dependent DNA helicase PcrA